MSTLFLDILIMWYVDEFPTDSNSDDIKKKENIEVMIVCVTIFVGFHDSELWSMLQNSQFSVKFIHVRLLSTLRRTCV